MHPKLKATTTSITSLNADGNKVIKALKKLASKANPNDLIEIAELVDKKPGAIKKALQYKRFI